MPLFFALDAQINVYPEDDYPIANLNYRFRENGVGYRFDVSAQKLIKTDDNLLHKDAIQPVLMLLREKRFATANAEFLEAFEDFKKSDFDDCLTKCGKAFESVMKVICHSKKWPYSQNDATKALLDTIRTNSNIPPFLDQTLMIKRLSKKH